MAIKQLNNYKKTPRNTFFSFFLQYVCLRHCSERRFQSKPISDSCPCTQDIEIHRLFLFKHELPGPKKLTYTQNFCDLCDILRLH